MIIDHRYSSQPFLAVTVQSKVAVVKLLKRAPAMGQVVAAPGQVETPSEMSEHGPENASLRKSKFGEFSISYHLHFSSDNCPVVLYFVQTNRIWQH